MSNVNDGGQAFPYFFPQRDEEIGTLPCAYQPGMSLRAYFAGQALAGMVAGSRGLGITTAQFAKQSVVLADALIEELNR